MKWANFKKLLDPFIKTGVRVNSINRSHKIRTVKLLTCKIFRQVPKNHVLRISLHRERQILLHKLYQGVVGDMHLCRMEWVD